MEKTELLHLDEIRARYQDRGLSVDEYKKMPIPKVARMRTDIKRLLLYIDNLRALKEAEQKRQEGCIRCEQKSCDTCYRFGWHPDICRKCKNQSHYSGKPFCSNCGRDLRGESHDDN